MVESKPTARKVTILGVCNDSLGDILHLLVEVEESDMQLQAETESLLKYFGKETSDNINDFMDILPIEVDGFITKYILTL